MILYFSLMIYLINLGNGKYEISKEEFYKLKYCSTVVYMVPRA